MMYRSFLSTPQKPHVLVKAANNFDSCFNETSWLSMNLCVSLQVDLYQFVHDRRRCGPILNSLAIFIKYIDNSVIKSVFCSPMGTFKEVNHISVPAVGRSVRLGSLYDIRTHTVIPGLALWTHQEVYENTIRERTNENATFELEENDNEWRKNSFKLDRILA